MEDAAEGIYDLVLFGIGEGGEHGEAEGFAVVGFGFGEHPGLKA
jgi:hypothetical protein